MSSSSGFKSRTLLASIWHKWQKFGHFMGNVVARLILAVFYCIIFAPFAIVSRFLLDPFGRKTSENSSFWLPRETRDRRLRDCKQQF